MVEMRGLVNRGSIGIIPNLNDEFGRMADRNVEHIRSRRKDGPRGIAGRTRLVAAMVIMAAFLLSAAFAVPMSLSTDKPDKTVPVNPLGTVGDVSWTNESPSISPGPRYSSAFVYDPPTDTYILFGGVSMDEDGAIYHNDTWSYDHGTNSWQNRSPASNPERMAGPAYAYDPVDEVMLLFPCIRYYPMIDAAMNETWAYDASTNEWKDLEATNAPFFRMYPCGAYDSESDRFVIFGGLDFSTFSVTNETWSYDFTSNTWTDMTPVHSPPGAYASSMVYDSESDRIILFGGLAADMSHCMNGTWSYDIDSNTWTEMAPHSGPSERIGLGAVYDPVSDLAMTFGGIGLAYGGVEPESVYFDDLWTYDYNTDTWSEVSQLSKPSPRALGMMAIDSWTRVVVLYGGAFSASPEDTPIVYGDTWSVQLGVPIPEFHTVVLLAVGMISIVSAFAGLRRRGQNRTLD